MRVLLYTLFCLSLTPSLVNAEPRCLLYKQAVAKAHHSYFGLDYPVHFGLGQLQQESSCRDVVSKDGHGSSTPAQITYKFWDKEFNRAGLASAHWTTQQAYIMNQAHDKNPYKKLWVTYQIYNGGNWVNKEIAAAGIADWASARDKCTRGYTTFKSGQKVSNCDINYDYSVLVFKYGNRYSSTSSAKYAYW